MLNVRVTFFVTEESQDWSVCEIRGIESREAAIDFVQDRGGVVLMAEII